MKQSSRPAAAPLKLDRIDREILRILQTEGRLPAAKLAERVHLSPSPCWARVRRLEQAGVIRGYRAEIDLAGVVPVTTVFVQVTLATHTATDFAAFEDHVRGVPEVVECHSVGGGFDYLVKVAVPDVDAYQALIDRLLAAGIGIDKYFSYIVTRSDKPACGLPLDALLGEDR